MKAAVMTAFRKPLEMRHGELADASTTSYHGLLSMIASGAFKTERLLEGNVDAAGVNDVLNRMTTYQTAGFYVITSWAG
jgi:hypothetical protein